MRPTGTITFLFTDIEGSTRLWQEQPEAMRVALFRHDDILRRTVEARNGYVFKTVGDAFCCAFQSPRQALDTAVASQRDLVGEAWPQAIGGLRVRMALHCGTAEERDGDYFGTTLSRIARLLSTGHGGQILLSATAAMLVREDLAPVCSLLPLGAYTLRDLVEPEEIYQLVCDGLPSEFPPLRTLGAARHNLPLQTSTLIGREAESAAVRELLRQSGVRLVTLIGTGGTGKTRLALKVADDVLHDYAHGVWFVDLSSVTEPDRMPAAIVAALGLATTGQEASLDALKTYLRGRRLLLLLDNFEQIINAGRLVVELLAAAPGLQVLVTSREPLLVSGERTFAVPPLSLPSEDQRAAADLIRYESVALFVDRAKAARHDFELNDRNAGTVAAICARLDGLPLAIELAAARIRLFSPAVLLARLDDRLGLNSGRRDVPERQRTLRAAISWSHDLLDADERILFRRLSVFSGGFDLAAAETICGPGLAIAVLDGLESLLNKNLVRRVDDADDTLRCVMLETIRDYATERLAESGEEAGLHQQHAVYYDGMAREAAEGLRTAGQLALLKRLNRDTANLRSALTYLLERPDPTMGARMAYHLRDYWLYSYQHVEGEAWLQRVLMLDKRLPDDLRTDVLTAAGMTALYRADVNGAIQLLDEAREAAYRLGDRRRMAWADAWWVATKTGSPSSRDEALPRIEAAIASFREIGYAPGVTQAMNICGEYLRSSGELEAAEAVYHKLIPLAQEIGDYRRVVFQYMNLGTIAFIRDEWDEMRTYVRQGLRLSLEMGVGETVASFLALAAVVANRAGMKDTGARLVGAADGWFEDHSVRPQPADAASFVAMRNASRVGLTEVEYGIAWEQGRNLSLSAAVDLAEGMLATVEARQL